MKDMISLKLLMMCWSNLPIFHKSKHKAFPTSISAMEHDRISYQIARFYWESRLLFCMWLDGAKYTIPMINQCVPLVQQIHKELNHFGVSRTHSMLCNQYSSIDMYQNDATYVSRCKVCYRVWSSFNTL